MDAPTSIGSAWDTRGLAHGQRELLELIDKLQFAQLDRGKQLDNVKVPRICVVGDQSAGKSSVLEAISGIPFPRDAAPCTRFATEIRFRRDPQASSKVFIIPDKNLDPKDQDALHSFGHRVDQNMSLEQLMQSAIELIAPKNIPARVAARDILVIEKRGPDMPLLTLVDLPGLAGKANNDQSLDDIGIIESLSESYMKGSRTIILAIVSGNNDYVQTPVLTSAQHFDPTGSRTIGVLSKPDLSEAIGREDEFIDLVNNKDKANVFKLGWHVLLNPGPREPGQAWPSADERRQSEAAFFGRGKWRFLPESMCGAETLKQKLSVQLQRHVGRYIKTLRRQVQHALDETEAELKLMGGGKDTPEEMRIELVELFSASKELVILAVYGFYKNPPGKSFFRSTADSWGTPAQNLRARAAEENDAFSKRIRQHGHKLRLAQASPDRSETLDARKQQQHILQEVQTLLGQIRGSEFPGDAKPRAVFMLFQRYSECWPKLAQEHKENLGVVCNDFLSELMDYTWPHKMREPLRREFLDPQVKKLMDHAQRELDLLARDMHLDVQPHDLEYEDKLRAWKDKSRSETAAPQLSEAQEVLEKMLIYYELSAKLFTRNIIVQVIERHLLQGMYGIFESLHVLRMSEETVLGIAAEDRPTRERRVLLKGRKKAIEEVKDISTDLMMRKEFRMYANEAVNDEEEEASSEEEDATAKHTRRSGGDGRQPNGVRVPAPPQTHANEIVNNQKEAEHTIVGGDDRYRSDFSACVPTQTQQTTKPFGMFVDFGMAYARQERFPGTSSWSLGWPPPE